MTNPCAAWFDLYMRSTASVVFGTDKNMRISSMSDGGGNLVTPNFPMDDKPDRPPIAESGVIPQEVAIDANPRLPQDCR
jgi:hypothetical protein